jgi:hypothetical protein
MSEITAHTWYYIEHQPIENYLNWITWLTLNIPMDDWKWDDHAGLLFICFRRHEDATAFKLKFEI